MKQKGNINSFLESLEKESLNLDISGQEINAAKANLKSIAGKKSVKFDLKWLAAAAVIIFAALLFIPQGSEQEELELYTYVYEEAYLWIDEDVLSDYYESDVEEIEISNLFDIDEETIINSLNQEE